MASHSYERVRPTCWEYNLGTSPDLTVSGLIHDSGQYSIHVTWWMTGG